MLDEGSLNINTKIQWLFFIIKLFKPIIIFITYPVQGHRNDGVHLSHHRPTAGVHPGQVISLSSFGLYSGHQNKTSHKKQTYCPENL